MTNQEPRLFVVIPTYNRWKEAQFALRHLRASTYRKFTTVLVEDGCSDGTVEKCAAEFPEVTMLHGDGNLWWSGAINKGVEYALGQGADAVVWLNDDNRVEPETLAHMVASHQELGAHSVICARTKAVDTGTDEWIGEPPRWHPQFGKWQAPEMTGPGVPVEHPPGGRGVLIPAECFRAIGLIDIQTFPHYWADHDFHYRAMKAGYKYFIAPDAVVWNVPNELRPEAKQQFTTEWARWFLFNRRSAMNMPTLRRLLKRHLSRSEYRKTFYPILFNHLAWLSYGWLTRKPLIHKPLRAVKRLVSPGKVANQSSR